MGLDERLYSQRPVLTSTGREDRRVHRTGRGRSLRDWQTIVTECAVSHGFDWTTGEVDTMLLRIHSEVSEAGEALRDEDWTTFAEELADIFIRLVNCAEVMGVDLEGEVIAKHAKNMQRPRLHGKARK